MFLMLLMSSTDIIYRWIPVVGEVESSWTWSQVFGYLWRWLSDTFWHFLTLSDTFQVFFSGKSMFDASNIMMFADSDHSDPGCQIQGAKVRPRHTGATGPQIGAVNKGCAATPQICMITLCYVKIAIENGHLSWICPCKMVICHN